jgi:tRNA-2-methylthio-N6-dimethylallyladenosine synthase
MAFVYFQTYGCQMNVADSDELRRKLLNRGFSETDSTSEADLIVVNTCSVRQNAEDKAKARITQFSRIKKSHAQLWVTGCMAQRLGDTLKKQIRGISLVIGAKEMDNLDAIINQNLILNEFNEQKSIIPQSEASDFVTIIRGCNNYCAYCIVPYVRGTEISIPTQDIENSIKKRISEGVKEIVLLGQNVNSYDDNGIDFSNLLVRIASIDGLKRLRFMTSHPKDCSEKLIRTVADTPSLCHHFHLPVQAGSDRILAAMNRKYTTADYMNRVEMIRKYIPDADITTDIIVGFPTETEEEFEQTLNLVKEVRYTTAFMFAYSAREGTAAANTTDNIPKLEKLDRLGRLIQTQTTITRELYDSMIGKTIEVMINGRQEKREKLWMGQDSGCKRVLLACDNIQSGMILKTRVIRSSGMTLIGEDCIHI